jgi:hypothetical protein
MLSNSMRANFSGAAPSSLVMLPVTNEIVTAGSYRCRSPLFGKRFVNLRIGLA